MERYLFTRTDHASLHVPRVQLLEVVRGEHLRRNIEIDQPIRLNLDRVHLERLKVHLLVRRDKPFDLACIKQREADYFEALLPHDIDPWRTIRCRFCITAVDQPAAAASTTLAVFRDHSVDLAIAEALTFGSAGNARGFWAVSKLANLGEVACDDRNEGPSGALIVAIVASYLPKGVFVQFGVHFIGAFGLLHRAPTATPGSSAALSTRPSSTSHSSIGPISSHTSGAAACLLAAAAAARYAATAACATAFGCTPGAG